MPRIPSVWLRVVLLVILSLPYVAYAQQAPDPTRLALDATSLPPASPRHPYKFQFTAHGGIPPFKYALKDSNLPPEMTLTEDGLLTGTIPKVGQYHFTVTVTDSSRPPLTASRTYVLRGIAPMLLQWKRYAKVSGHRVDGSVVISNSTEDDFDFTFIVLAVAENGRATAIGYQHFPLKSGVEEFEIPFGENLPRGSYSVHVDAVGEVSEKDAIYRARLQTKENLQVVVGP